MGLLTLNAVGRRRVPGCRPGQCLGVPVSRWCRGFLVVWWCLGGVSVVTRGVSVVIRWFWSVSVASRWCLGRVLVVVCPWSLGSVSGVSWRCPCGVSVVSRWCIASLSLFLSLSLVCC